jgi:hypothetical protein
MPSFKERREDNAIFKKRENAIFNYLNAELNPICHLLALLGAHYILHVSRLRVKERREDNAIF